MGSLALALLTLLVITGLPAAASAQDKLPDIQALMRRVDELWRGDSSRADMSMTVKTQHYERTMSMESWSEGSSKSLVVIREPKKDQGIATLKVDENIWNYLPKINRVTKVPPSMMMGSWMGSHFTNDDLVKESTYEDDYSSEITFAGQRNGRAIYEVTGVPKPDAAVVWGKVEMDIEQERLLPVEARYFDEDGKLVRTMVFEDVRKVGDRTLPMKMVLTPADKPGEFTEVAYNDIQFGVKLPPDQFSLQRLRSAR